MRAGRLTQDDGSLRVYQMLWLRTSGGDLEKGEEVIAQLRFGQALGFGNWD